MKEDEMSRDKGSTKSDLYHHAKRQLQENGLLDKDSDYNGALGHGVLNIIDMISEQGHSGASLEQTLQLVNTLARFKDLSEHPADSAITGKDLRQKALETAHKLLSDPDVGIRLSVLAIILQED